MPINENLAKLILRVTVGGLMIFHGIHKVINGHDFIRLKLTEVGLPEFIALGVPVGEVLAPALLILGYKTRLSALVIAFTMVMSIFLVFSDKLFSLNQNGGIAYELNIFFLLASIAIYFQGAGKYSLSSKVSAID
nr:DoxX family protein [Bacteriovorax sp. HI3]